MCAAACPEGEPGGGVAALLLIGELSSGVRMTACSHNCKKILLSEQVSYPKVANGGVADGSEFRTLNFEM